jgi:hypothetical protein
MKVKHLVLKKEKDCFNGWRGGIEPCRNSKPFTDRTRKGEAGNLKEPCPLSPVFSNPESWVPSEFKPTREHRSTRATRRFLRSLRERVKTFRRTEERKESIGEIVLVDLHVNVTACFLRTPLPSNTWTTLRPPQESQDEVSVDLPAADVINEPSYQSSTLGTTSCIFPLVLNQRPSEASGGHRGG